MISKLSSLPSNLTTTVKTEAVSKDPKVQETIEGCQHRILFLLDRSGSMGCIKASTIKSFNEFVSGQKAEHPRGTIRFSLLQFDTELDVVFEPMDIHDIPELTDEVFKPRGSTALYDAMATTIDDLGKELSLLPEENRPKVVMMVVLTDGEENASEKYQQNDVFNRVSHQQEKYSWKFMYLGANQDAIKEAGKMGICQESSIEYGYNDEKVCAAMSTACQGVTSTLNTGRSYKFSNQDRERCR